MKKTVCIFFIFIGLFLHNNTICQSLEPKIISVSVDTTDPGNQGAVKILYESNTDVDIDDFRIWYFFNNDFREQNLSINNAATEFKYTSAEADERSEGFRLRTVLFSDPSLALLSKPHFTVFLKAEEFNECNKTIILRWNNYIGWGSDITGYDVFVNKENSGYVKRTTLTDTVFVETDVPNATNYKFYVIAKNSSGAESMSNIVEYTSDLKKEINPTLFYIESILNLENSVELSFKTDNSFETGAFKILMSDSYNNGFTEVGDLNYEDKDMYTYTHSEVKSSVASFYKIQNLNICDELLGETNTVQKIVLLGTMEDNIVSLNWNACFHEFDENFNVLMSIDGSEFTPVNSDVSNNNATVNLIEQSNNGESEYFCFKVSSNLVSGWYGESNVQCFELAPEIDMPNAFSPNGDGTNDYIGPKINYVDIQDYTFIIYDRFGGKIFESKNEDEKWFGTINDKPVKEGAYIYYLYYKTARGKEYEKSGSINVVFP